ncbi:MAG: translation elongation factor Ts [Planctomycetota bacterium]
MTITAAKVRELREMTGAGMMDCKKALESSSGDIEGAVDFLRKAGLKSAAKKAERETSEGRVHAVVDASGKKGHLVAVACETDFLSKGDGFQALIDELGEVLTNCDPDGLDSGDRPLMTQGRSRGEGTVTELLQEVVGQMGENIQIVDFARFENAEGLIGVYVHHDGKQAAMASVTTGADAGAATETLKALCQHIVVFPSEGASRDDIPADVVERERGVILESGDLTKKPAEIQEKILAGRMEKFFAGIVVSEQPWIHDDKQTVQKALEASLGAGTRIESFRRFRIG